MLDELEDNREGYNSILHEDWCDFLSTIEVKDNMERFVTQIKRLVTYKLASNYETDESVSYQIANNRGGRRQSVMGSSAI